MFGAILKATNSSFQEGMTFCRSIYVKKVMKLLAFIFEQPSYMSTHARFSISFCTNQQINTWGHRYCIFYPIFFLICCPFSV